ncbi:MAG: helix-turn-helix transcriptional regulator [Candidatus Cloacimonetes bacterium]|nr:helix-turn-helix transcriptional regulator [Candidatus Cloacimonadota bacterium]
MNNTRRTHFFSGEWEDFELDFIEKHFPLWKQNIIQVVSRLLKHRLRMAMSQEELAERIGTTQSAIARFERLKRMPSLEYIYRVAEGLGAEIKPLKLLGADVALPKDFLLLIKSKPQWEKDLYQIVYSLKEYRIRHCMSQADLAEKIGTSQSVIARFEAMGRKPTLEFIYRVAEGLGLELQLLSAEKKDVDHAGSVERVWDMKNMLRSRKAVFKKLEVPLLRAKSRAQLSAIFDAKYNYSISKHHTL